MRTVQEVHRVDQLVKLGFNDREISRRTGIPRGTVRDWRRGRRPNFDRIHFAHGRHTDGVRLRVNQEEAYAYLLGLYLGDGHITRMQRTYRLRICLDSAYPGIVVTS